MSGCARCGNPLNSWATTYCSATCRAQHIGDSTRTPLDECYEVRESGCWEWSRAISPDGYGKVRVRGTTLLAHRWVWVELVGPIPEGLELDHLCRNKRCVNPAHLEPVSRAENMRRMGAVRTTCRNGHPLDGRRKDNGRRYCRTCNRVRLSERREEARRVLAA